MSETLIQINQIEHQIRRLQADLQQDINRATELESQRKAILESRVNKQENLQRLKNSLDDCQKRLSKEEKAAREESKKHFQVLSEKAQKCNSLLQQFLDELNDLKDVLADTSISELWEQVYGNGKRPLQLLTKDQLEPQWQLQNLPHLTVVDSERDRKIIVSTITDAQQRGWIK